MSSKIERYVIKHLSGTKANQVEEFDFDKAELTLGRTSGSDIQFDPEQDATVSREHGKIVKVSSEPPKFNVVDNNSRNGIFINKSRVKGTQELKPGDEVQLGSGGPVFSFDIYPRPQDMMMATKLMEIPTSIKATTISEISPVTAEPVKTGLGKQTVERMLVAERKKSMGSMAYVLIGLVAVLAILGYVFRDRIFGHNTVVMEHGIDSAGLRKRSPEMIAKENEDRVVQIEFGWQIYDAGTSDELWHKYTIEKGEDGNNHYAAVYIENAQGQIEPYLDIKKNVPLGTPVGIPSASGSGFIVSQDGFILTNRHVGAGWNTRYQFNDFAFPGILVRNVNGTITKVPGTQVYADQVVGWVPAEATMVGGNPARPGSVKGRNTYMNVIFAGTSLRRPVQSSTPSDEHDVAMIKVDLPESLSKVTMNDNYDNIKPGQAVTVMGYPGIAPTEFVIRKSNDPFNQNNQITTIPTPTVTPGNIGRIIPASSSASAKNTTYSSFGDSYQLTINATGPGNSGGPMFDDEGRVIGIYYAGKTDGQGTNISFAVPIKYGLELMGRRKVTN